MEDRGADTSDGEAVLEMSAEAEVKATQEAGDQLSGSPSEDGGGSNCAEPEATNMSASEVTVNQSTTTQSSLTLEEEVEGDRTVSTEEEEEEEEEAKTESDREATTQETEWQDILGNGQLMKKVLRKGEGISTRPTSQSRVKVRTHGYLESGDVVDKHSGYWFTVGDGDVVQAWDIAVTLMERGEMAKVKTSSRFAYGTNGKGSSIPGDATITYELELLEVLEPVQFGSLSEEELVKIVEKKKTRGNELYQDKEYNGAIKSYHKGLQAIQSYLDARSIASNVPSNLIEMQIRCLNNIAAAQLKVKQYREALSACEKVLDKDPDNVKALYRAGRVLSHIGELEDAVSKLQKALSLSPDDKTIQTELKRTFKKKEVALKKEKEMYRRMIDHTPKPKKSTPHRDNSWGPWPYMFIAGTTAVVAMGIAYFFTQRH